jgi:hypothetical protein
VKALPRALVPWSEELAVFSDEGRALFASWLPALDRLLGPHAEETDPAGDPDGFSGLGRRGRYERLALSQWGLLDAAPDEFLRRAGSSEHLFHQIARSARSGGRRLVVLFDAGPAQLGAPRLVHLAWLMVLGRRARRRGVRLHWGILQTPPALREGADVPAVRALLAARSGHPVTAAHVTAWREMLGAPLDSEERWVVSAKAEGASLSAAAFTVAEPDDPGDHLLRVEATPRHGPRARARLPLREGTSRLLVDPFRHEERTGTSAGDDVIGSGAQVVFSGGGNHLVARLASGGVVAFAIPARPDARFLPLARFSPPTGDHVVAAGWAKGSMYVATVTEERRVALHVSQGRRWRTNLLGLPPGLPPPRPSSTVLGALMVDRRSGGVRFQDAGWRLFQGHVEGGHLSVLPETVLACVSVQACLVTLGRVGDGPLETFQHRRGGLDRKVAFDDMPRAKEGFLCVAGDGRPLLAAVSVGGTVWWVKNLSTNAEASFRLAGGAPVFGTELSGPHSCLLLRRGEDELELATPVRPHETFRFPGPVEHAALQPGGGRLLAAQVNGGLVLLHRRGLLLGRWGGRR